MLLGVAVAVAVDPMTLPVMLTALLVVFNAMLPAPNVRLPP